MINDMIKGVSFDGKHSYWEYGLITASAPVVSPPKPKTKIVEIPGADGALDLTESLTGEVHYEMRTITCKFKLMGYLEKQNAISDKVFNALHGKRFDQIVLDTDETYYYTGRAAVTAVKHQAYYGDMTIVATVEPRKRPRFYEGEAVL